MVDFSEVVRSSEHECTHGKIVCECGCVVDLDAMSYDIRRMASALRVVTAMLVSELAYPNDFTPQKRADTFLGVITVCCDILDDDSCDDEGGEDAPTIN